MGYITKDIAVITEPKILTLSAAPNYVTFASKAAVKVFLEATLQVNAVPNWRIGFYYNSTGTLIATPGSVYWKASRQFPIVAYAGQSFTYNGRSDTGAWCHIYDINRVRLTSFQSTPSGYTAVFPANAHYIALSNGNSNAAAVPPTLMVGGINRILAEEVTSVIRLVEPSGVVHAYHGTSTVADVGGNVYFLSQDTADNAENLRQAMLSSVWIRANLELTIPPLKVGNALVNGSTIYIKSKGAGSEYNVAITTPDNNAGIAYMFTWVNQTSTSGDSISGEDATAEIELDVYTGGAVKLGEDDTPTTTAKLGTLALTLQKSYAGVPLWFNVNTIFTQYQGFNMPPTAAGWFNTGTVNAFRFIARKKAMNSFSFYQSSMLYVLSGHGYASEALDLTPYVYVADTIKLLTNKPRTPYVKGQREYLNFVFGGAPTTAYNVAVLYQAFTTADVFIGELVAHTKSSATLSTVNTCVLNIDALLAAYPNAGIVRVALQRDGAPISNFLEYLIRPQSLHTLTQFTFLNRLGGWDAINFDAPVKYDIKSEVETYSKSMTPAFKRGDSIETVYTAALDEARTVEGAPVSEDVAEWLKELATSRTILDTDGYYVITEDFTLPISAASTNMQIPIIKYKLSETYTND